MFSPLHIVLENNHTPLRTINTLINLTANINARDDEEDTPLHMALKHDAYI
jgi:ankyrin repeat protein